MSTGIVGGNVRTQHVYALAVAPASVAANTTVEQTFTLTGLRTFHAPMIIKPTLQAGLGIFQARCSANDTIAITYANLTASPITPTTETYTVFIVSPEGGIATTNFSF